MFIKKGILKNATCPFKLVKINVTKKENQCSITTLFLRNLRRTYVLIMLLYSYVKTPYLTQQVFTCAKSTIETLEKGLTYVQI